MIGGLPECPKADPLSRPEYYLQRGENLCLVKNHILYPRKDRRIICRAQARNSTHRPHLIYVPESPRHKTPVTLILLVRSAKPTMEEKSAHLKPTMKEKSQLPSQSNIQSTVSQLLHSITKLNLWISCLYTISQEQYVQIASPDQEAGHVFRSCDYESSLPTLAWPVTN